MAGNSIAITGGHVVPIEGDPIENGTVLLADGKIAAVAGPDFEPPPGADLVDALVARGHKVTLIGAGDHGTRAQRFLTTFDEGPASLGRQRRGPLANGGRHIGILAERQEQQRGRLGGAVRAGRVLGVTGVPGHPERFYFGSVGGGVWRTDNANGARSKGGEAGAIGHPYRAYMHFETGRYAFCKIVQQPGELAIQERPVIDIPRVCSGKA